MQLVLKVLICSRVLEITVTYIKKAFSTKDFNAMKSNFTSFFVGNKTRIVGQFLKKNCQCELSQDMLICGFKNFNPQFDAAYGTN